MAKGNNLSEFAKGKIAAMKRVGKSQREISKALRRKVQISKEQENRLAGQKILTIIQQKNCS